jgi:hypothetical protein
MKVVLKHYLGQVTIETDVYDDPDKIVVPKVTFDSKKEEELNKHFYAIAEGATGAYGHGFSIKSTTNFDLDCALSRFTSRGGFELVSRDPDGIKANPNFPPKGAKS